MRVRVLFFGMLKEVAGRERDSVELPERSRVSDLLGKYAAMAPALKPYYDVMAVALNQEYSNPDAPLHEGDEVALIPPVSGGKSGAGKTRQGKTSKAKAADRSVRATQAMTGVAGGTPALRGQHARIVREKIDAHAVADAIKQPADGAVAVFEGIVRDHSRGRRTRYLDYEAYEPMALKQMEELAERALQQFKVREVALVHRLGRLQIGETSVLVAVAAAHRGPAFDGCRWLIDTLKKTVPIWKKEHFEDGAVWADGEPFPAEVSRAGAGIPAASK